MSVLISLWKPFDVSVFDAFALSLLGDEDVANKANLRLSMHLSWLEKMWTNLKQNNVSDSLENCTEFDGVPHQFIALGNWLLNISAELLNPEVLVLDVRL